MIAKDSILGTIPHYTKIKKNSVQCCVCMTNQPWPPKLLCLIQCSTYQKRKTKHSHFKSSMLGSIPHHSTFMVKKGVQSWVCMTNTKLRVFNAGYNVLRTNWRNHAMHISLVILILNILDSFTTPTVLILSRHQQSWFFHYTNSLDSFMTPTVLILSQHQHSWFFHDTNILDSFTTPTFLILSRHQHSWFFHDTNILDSFTTPTFINYIWFLHNTNIL